MHLSSLKTLAALLSTVPLLTAAVGCARTTPTAPTPAPTAQIQVETVAVTAQPQITLRVVTLTPAPTATFPPPVVTMQAFRTAFAATLTAKPTLTPMPTSLPPQCTPTDQDAYVFWPTRFKIMSPCIAVQGVVRRSYLNAPDGDWIIDVDLDQPYKKYLVPANFTDLHGVRGALHVEAVCEAAPTEEFASDVCAKNPSPLPKPMPRSGQHVWMQGRWVLDNPWTGTGWAELHPLYRWGVIE